MVNLIYSWDFTVTIQTSDKPMGSQRVNYRLENVFSEYTCKFRIRVFGALSVAVYTFTDPFDLMNLSLVLLWNLAINRFGYLCNWNDDCPTIKVI